MVRGFLGGENHFLQFSFMRSDGAKKYFKNIFLKSSLEFVSLHFQTTYDLLKLKWGKYHRNPHMVRGFLGMVVKTTFYNF